ncbi:MAG TPA: HIT domain-containing protein [Desulfobacteraceae bacterium]|nr:HIT domain-containing protein [Desulfobacteraceae bacterium]HPJ69026.1 HIT domain-containing protein [Desulfobacteraceae bacterium]HPQ29717.1 HIT domain-containing protein [Desulfobacteraceae bacterium]
MEVIWAPWRMEYIVSDQKADKCIFCPGESRDNDEERLILFVGQYTMIMMNRFPYINGHLLVSPVRHVSDLSALSRKETFDLLDMVSKSVKVLKKVMSPEGFNIGLNLGRVAGAGIDSHIHFHIVPRWGGDTNYMSVLAEVRVIPEHIKNTYNKLMPHFKEFNNISGGDA